MQKSLFTMCAVVGICILAFMGCRKNASETSIEPNIDSRIEGNPVLVIGKAKSYFESTVQSVSTPTTASVPLYGKRTPLWEEAFISGYKGTETVIVPLQYEKNLSLKKGWDESNSYFLKDNSYLRITLGDKPNAVVETSIPGANLKGTSMNVTKYIVTEDWAGNTLDKILVTKDKGAFRFGSTSNIRSNGTRLNSSVCIHIIWELCDIIDGVTYNCEFVGTSTIGCDEGLEPVGEGGGGDENYTRYSSASWIVDPQIPNNDTIRVAAGVNVEGTGARNGIFTAAYWGGSSLKNGGVGYSYTQGGTPSVSYTSSAVSASFSGSIAIAGSTSFGVSSSRNFTWSQCFTNFP